MNSDSLTAIVRAYIRNYRAAAAEEFAFFVRSPLNVAVQYAALSELPTGKRHPHQRRIPGERLQEGERNLQACANELLACQRFGEVHAIVEREIGGIKGIGELAVYDVSTRIAAHLRIEPDRVYLHAGVRDGAQALGLDHRRASLDLAELPKPFRRLRPCEIEDCLCIYKRELANLRDRAV